jgi:putative flippase GtrA
MYQKIFLNVKQLLRMCMVGSIGFSVQIISYNLLRFFFSPLWSVQISIILATITNFYAHGHLTFSQGAKMFSKRGMIYFIYSLVMLICQGQWLHLGVKIFGEQALIENLIILTGLMWGTLINFLFYRYYLWPKSE